MPSFTFELEIDIQFADPALSRPTDDQIYELISEPLRKGLAEAGYKVDGVDVYDQ